MLISIAQCSTHAEVTFKLDSRLKSALLVSFIVFSPSAKASNIIETCANQIYSKLASVHNLNNQGYDFLSIKGYNPFQYGLRSLSLKAKWNAQDEWIPCSDTRDWGRDERFTVYCGDTIKISNEFRWGSRPDFLPYGRITLIARNDAEVEAKYISRKILSCNVFLDKHQLGTNTSGMPVRTYPFKISWIAKLQLKDTPRELFLLVDYNGLTRNINEIPIF
jgi:hypothetical protein